ncbi:replicative DNA helicase loader DnaB [Scopulibacillus darangshiensis]|uniref:Replicative DNA helicase loader DnaB n=1 Tax=Scopulibacillus darangshiensis TaxID=442528 RepID=A0A4V2SNQ5_9BACL|nr:DnaD domain protein [Scopulibacillus darangshiensis]TCP32106.1 replicative DNA helicase loader DnaB [Scopulibacillus darangshiensis]
MQHHWKDMLPGDRYVVRLNGLLHFFDQKVITRLYQPLIGPGASSLYTTLWHEVDDRLFISGTLTHHHLMVSTNTPLSTLLQERKKLEAIGLLKTFKKKEKDQLVLFYELQPPLTPKQFFTDGLLNIYLYNRIGHQDYNRLKQSFIQDKLSEQDIENVTVDFNDIFQSVHPSELKNNDQELQESNVWLDREQSSEPILKRSFDFDELYRYISSVIISKEAFTVEVKEAIEKLSFVYQLTPLDMSKVIQEAFIHTGEIDIQVLRKEVRNYYRLEAGVQLPALSSRLQPLSAQEMAGKTPQTDVERQIQQFELMSPYDILEQMADGGEPAAPDLRLVEEILFEQKLNPGVVNVLIHYVMVTNDQKLIKSYVEKLAGHWARKKIKTVREAMALAKSEFEKTQEWSATKKGHRTKAGKNSRQDKLPKWMTGETEAKESSENKISKEEAVQKEKWLEEYLNNL